LSTLLRTVDHLENTRTNYSYDNFGNAISTESQQLKTTVSTDTQGRTTNAKYVLKELNNLAQSYKYDYIDAVEPSYYPVYNPKGNPKQFKTTLPNNATETLSYDKLDRITAINAPAGTQNLPTKQGRHIQQVITPPTL
jgi:YD repeat-containing protein